VPVVCVVNKDAQAIRFKVPYCW